MKNNVHYTEIMSSILSDAARSADQAEVFRLNAFSSSVGFRSGQLRAIDESQNSGISLRIIQNGRLSQVSSSNMDIAGKLPGKALELVPFGESVAFDFPDPVPYPDLSGELFSHPEISMDDMIQCGRILVETIRERDPSVNPDAGISSEGLEIHIMNSNDLNCSYKTRTLSTFVSGTFAVEGNILSTYTVHLGHTLPEDPPALAEKILHYIDIGRKNIPFSSETIPIVFSPNAFSSIMAAFSSGINGTNIARNISPLKGKIGEQILHEKFSILDDSLYPGGINTHPFDDEGIPARKKYLVENGILKNYLLDLNAAAKLNVKSTGNGFRYSSLIQSRSYKAAPGPNFSNVILPKGDRTFHQILRNFKRIVFVDQITGVLLGNLINGDFSGNLEYGILYENGEPVGRIKNTMTGGNFYRIFKDQFIEFSSEREWVSGFGGSGNSNLFPYVFVDGMNISARN